jgi:hypothetical protein
LEIIIWDFAGATYRLPVSPRPLGLGALEEGGWTDMGAREKLGSENEPNDVRTYVTNPSDAAPKRLILY